MKLGYYTGLRLGICKPDPRKLPRFNASSKSRRKVTMGVFSATMDSSEYTSPDSVKSNETDVEADPPVLGAVVFTIGWLFLCAAMFCLWEEWT